MTARKILGFDSWTGGSGNWGRLVAPLAAAQCEFYVLHIGSWGGDVRKDAREVLDGVVFRDVSTFGGAGFSEILRREKPDAVLFLSTDTFAHRDFIRRCRLQGIPTLHLYHGLVSVQQVATKRSYKVNPLAQMKFVLERLPKALRHTWPSYANSLLLSRAGLSDWWRFVSDVGVMASGRRSTFAAPDAKTDRCCVYVQADVAHAVRRYGFKSSEVIPVGNPDIARFGLTQAVAGCQASVTENPSADVMYIDTGLIYTGLVFSSPAQFVQHLLDTRDSLRRQGYRLVFKPHPDHGRTGMLEQFKAVGIEICTQEEFTTRLSQCAAAIVEPSSLSVAPALLGLPLLLAQYGPLQSQAYGLVLTSYPRHACLSSLEQATVLIQEMRKTPSAEQVRNWINMNLGPLPAERMPERVLDVVTSLMRPAAERAVVLGA